MQTTARRRLARRLLLDPVAHFPLERPVVQRDLPRPVRAGFEQRLIPQLRLRADVGEYQRTLRALDGGDHSRQLLEAQMSRPGKALDRGRDQAVDNDRLGVEAAHDAAAAVPTDQALERLVQIGKRRRQGPGWQRRVALAPQLAQAGERELDLDAALGR